MRARRRCTISARGASRRQGSTSEECGARAARVEHAASLGYVQGVRRVVALLALSACGSSGCGYPEFGFVPEDDATSIDSASDVVVDAPEDVGTTDLGAIDSSGIDTSTSDAGLDTFAADSAV